MFKNQFPHNELHFLLNYTFVHQSNRGLQSVQFQKPHNDFFLAISSGTFHTLLVEDLVLSKNKPAVNQWVENICL